MLAQKSAVAPAQVVVDHGVLKNQSQVGGKDSRALKDIIPIERRDHESIQKAAKNV